MKCPECGKQTEGRDHNKRGLRCTSCWALLPDMPEPPKPKRRRKPKPRKLHESPVTFTDDTPGILAGK